MSQFIKGRFYQLPGSAGEHELVKQGEDKIAEHKNMSRLSKAVWGSRGDGAR